MEKRTSMPFIQTLVNTWRSQIHLLRFVRCLLKLLPLYGNPNMNGRIRSGYTTERTLLEKKNHIPSMKFIMVRGKRKAKMETASLTYPEMAHELVSYVKIWDLRTLNFFP